MSAYTYANDRPTVLTDPAGLSPVCRSFLCFLKSIPGTIKCEPRHPGQTAGVVVGWGATVGFAYGGWYVAGEIAASEAPGFLAALDHPVCVGMGGLGRGLLSFGSGVTAYKRSQTLAEQCSK